MIPLFKPSCSDLEIEYVTEVLRSGWWGMGPKAGELEEQFAAYAGSLHAVAVSNCTMALQLTLQALGISDGEVIIPGLTFAATGLAVLHSGAKIVFADIDENTLCIDWDDTIRKITPQTKAIIPVWYAGRVALPARWASSVPWVIEDCAHAAGTIDAGRAGDASCWSFNAVKNLASGDGGMITTNDFELASKLRGLRRFGIDGKNWDYEIPEPGWKADMNDITAAVALAQLERLDENNSKRRNIVQVYLDQLKDLSWLRLPEWRAGASWHMFTVRTEHRDEFISHLRKNDVSAGVHYKPLNKHGIFGHCELPVTGRVWKTLVTLPLYPDMTEEDISMVVGAVRSFRAFQ